MRACRQDLASTLQHGFSVPYPEIFLRSAYGSHDTASVEEGKIMRTKKASSSWSRNRTEMGDEYDAYTHQYGDCTNFSF